MPIDRDILIKEGYALLFCHTRACLLIVEKVPLFHNPFHYLHNSMIQKKVWEQVNQLGFCWLLHVISLGIFLYSPKFKDLSKVTNTVGEQLLIAEVQEDTTITLPHVLMLPW